MAGRPRFGQSFPEFQNMEAIQQLALSQNNFTRDLYLALAKETEGNMFFSPFSIMTALSMAHMGTAKQTEDQVNKVLHLQDKGNVKDAFKEVIADYQKIVSEYELNTSNMMYVSQNLQVLDDFMATLTGHFHSSSKTVDFKEHETVRQEINTRVEKETKDKIKDLIAPGILNADTAMVLVNAVYFKGLWEHTFKAADTTEEDFFVTPENPVKVPMMHIKKNFRWSVLKDLDANLLSMDYKGGRLSMIIVLPNALDGLKNLEEKMTSENILLWDKRAASVEVEVTLPKFKLEQTLQLPKILAKMGMTDLFTDKCDLSGISKDPLYVSDVIHKAFIEVNEEGSEAAAATVMVMNRMALIRQPGPFVANRPFLFFIRDRLSNLTLFTGRFINPIKSASKDEL